MSSTSQTVKSMANDQQAPEHARKRLKSQHSSASQGHGLTSTAAHPQQQQQREPEQELRWRRLELGIEVDGANVPPMLDSFDALVLPDDVVAILGARGIRQPTAIQRQAIPCIVAGRDLIGLAATGSGKTLSYVLPWVLRCQPRASTYPANAAVTPSALVIVPTRELMNQVFEELRQFAGVDPSGAHGGDAMQIVCIGRRYSIGCVCGGVDMNMQMATLRRFAGGIDIVVATPGRLLHLIDEKRVVDLSALQYLVIDEVDRMLDATMEPQLRRILHAANERGRQTLLWSATMPAFLDRLARSAVLDAVTVRVGMGRNKSGRTALRVRQDVVYMRSAEKKPRLLRALRSIPAPPVVVFCNSHDGADYVTRFLRHEQFRAASLHGEKSQAYRFQLLTAFREGYVDVLVATDLASRGLDFADVHHVILYDMPLTIEDYIHRCGRTGRQKDGVLGQVTAFLTSDCVIAPELKKLLQETKQVIPAELGVPTRFRSADE